MVLKRIYEVSWLQKKKKVNKLNKEFDQKNKNKKTNRHVLNQI